MSKLQPFINISPGDLIKEELEFYDLSQKDLANIVDITEKHLSKIVNGKVRVSSNIAKSLSQVFKQSPEFWLKADYDYQQLKNCRVEEREKEDLVTLKATIYKYMPIRQMQRLNWISKWSTFDDFLKDICSFWIIDSPNFDFLNEDSMLCLHKRSDAATCDFNYYYSKAWLQKAKLISESITLPYYDKASLSYIFDNLANYTNIDDGISQVINDLKDAGVGFFVLPHLQKTYLDGACFKQGNNPFLVYTGRYDRNDNFWFVLGHEIAHILYHLDTGIEAFLETNDINKDDNITHLEKEANVYSQAKLKSKEILSYFSDTIKIKENSILACSDQLNIHPALVIGFLQYNNKLSWRSNLNCFKHKVIEYIDNQYKY